VDPDRNCFWWSDPEQEYFSHISDLSDITKLSISNKQFEVVKVVIDLVNALLP